MKPCSTTPGSSRHSPSAAPGQRVRLVKSWVQAVDGTSVMPPSSPFCGPRAQQHMTVGADDDEGRAAAQRPSAFGALRGNVSASPRARATQASIHGQMPQAGLLRRADGGAEIHHRLGEIAGARAAAPALGAARGFPASPPAIPSRWRTAARSRARCCRRSPPRAGRTRSPRSPPRCRRRCRAARAAPSSVSGNRPPCCAATALRAGMQVAGARVIAEPGPGLEHVVERRCGQRLDARPAREEVARNRARPPSRWSAAA